MTQTSLPPSTVATILLFCFGYTLSVCFCATNCLAFSYQEVSSDSLTHATISINAGCAHEGENGEGNDSYAQLLGKSAV